MQRTQIQLEEDQIEWLKSEARARGISISQLIRQGMAFFRLHEERLPEDKKKRALAAVGRFTSGLSDVSSNHDAYLEKAYHSADANGK
jgi:hypothetical protein